LFEKHLNVEQAARSPCEDCKEAGLFQEVRYQHLEAHHGEEPQGWPCIQLTAQQGLRQNDESKGLDELQWQVVEENKVGEICLDLGREETSYYYPFAMNCVH